MNHLIQLHKIWLFVSRSGFTSVSILRERSSDNSRRWKAILVLFFEVVKCVAVLAIKNVACIEIFLLLRM